MCTEYPVCFLVSDDFHKTVSVVVRLRSAVGCHRKFADFELNILHRTSSCHKDLLSLIFIMSLAH